MLTIDHSNIPHDVLTIALANAVRDPDGQVFPWRPMYPLAGGTVYHDGQLWTVVDKDYGGAPPCALLVGSGHDGESAMAETPRGERVGPVELELGSATRRGKA